MAVRRHDLVRIVEAVGDVKVDAVARCGAKPGLTSTRERRSEVSVLMSAAER